MRLESIVGCPEKLDKFEKAFDQFINDRPVPNIRGLLDDIKFFLGSEKRYRNDLFKSTLLRGSDCLTMATLASILAHRKGYSVQICRPNSLKYACHAVLSYIDEDGKPSIFKVTGRRSHDSYVALSDYQVILRLKTTKPVIDWINSKILRKY